MPRSPHVPASVPAHNFEFPGLRIGVAEYEEGPTGVTVFHFPERAYAVVDVRGGSPGSAFTDLLTMSFGKFVSAIALCGGSAYGLEAAAGVASCLMEAGNASTEWGEVAVVPAAVVFDFKGRQNRVYPDSTLGRTALQTAREGWFPYGACGAGRFVHAGSYFGEDYMERSGQGAAFGAQNATKVAVFTVVNSRGVVMDRAGNPVLGNRNPESGERVAVSASLRSRKPGPTELAPSAALCQSTTLTLLVTTACMTKSELTRLAVTIHSSMARAIQPFHTERDGDILFAASTAEVSSKTDLSDLAVLASELAWDAVLNCVPDPTEVGFRRA
jgi:L-aminopeptidase/D-esterase-like protein